MKKHNIKRLLMLLCASTLLTCGCAETWLDNVWTSNVQHEQDIKENSARIEALFKACEALNKEIGSAQQLLEALDKQERILTVTELSEDGKHIGYRISFLRHEPIDILDGKDVEERPDIGLAPCDGGYIAWTYDGRFILDADGNPAKAYGEDAVTPVLKIEDGVWMLSYDGENWMPVGPSDGVAGDAMISSIDTESDPDNVIFTLAGGSSFSIRWYREMKIDLDIEGDETGIEARKKITVNYSIRNALPGTIVTVASDGNYFVQHISNDNESGKIIVTGPKTYEDGHFTVIASDNEGHTIYRVVNFYERRIILSRGEEFSVSARGGEIRVPVSANFDYRLEIPDEAAWIQAEEMTKAEMKDSEIVILASPNRSTESRTAEVMLYAKNDPSVPLRVIKVIQAGAEWSLERSKYTVRSEGITIETTIVSTFGVRLESHDPWIEIESYSEDEVHYDVKLIVSPNKSASRRSSSMTIFDLEGEGRAIIKVVQVADGEDDPDDMIFIARANLANDYTVQLPLAKVEDCIVDWGDGSTPEVVHELPSHRYPAENKNYRIHISGSVTALSSYNIKSPSIVEVVQWGHTGLYDMNGAFADDTYLEKIATDEDGSFSEVANFSQCFMSCTSLKEIPKDLFRYGHNIRNINHTFRDCRAIEEIPERLLEDCTSLVNIDGMFMDCTALESIPEKLFWDSRNITRFDGVFQGCANLRSIPEDLLRYCNKVTSLSSTFSGCSTLSSIPSRLLSYCPELEYMWQTFVDCSGLKTLPADMFDHNRKLSYMQEVFFCCDLEGESPYTIINGRKIHLYERYQEPDEFVGLKNQYTYNRSFVGNRFTDQEAIPSNWKY